MRSLLKFLGAGSSALCTILLASALTASSGWADEDPQGRLFLDNCLDCCVCSQAQQSCKYSGAGKGCRPSIPCNCDCLNTSGTTWLCKDATLLLSRGMHPQAASGPAH